MSSNTEELTDIMKMVMESDSNSSDDDADTKPAEHTKLTGGSLKSKRQHVSSASDISRDTSSLDPAKAIRDSVYSQWLSEKKAKIKEKKIKETKSKSELQNEELQAIAKKEQLEADCKKAYKIWKAKKDKDMMEKLKIKQEKEREEEEASKADERKQQAEIVIASWQKQKGEKLKGLHAKQAKQREEEKQRLEQEAERKSISRLAFDKWLENKNKVLSETHKLQKQEQQPKIASSDQNLSKMAFDHWKQRKDEEKKLLKSTVKVTEKTPKQPWRPARAVQYNYLKSPSPLPNERTRKNDDSASVDTNCSSTSSSTTIHSTDSSTQGRLKTVKVCCQTLQYECICKKP